MRAATLLLSLTLLPLSSGCGNQAPRADDQPLNNPPIDTARVPAIEEIVKWPHTRAVDTDLNGDGAPERLVVASDVQLNDRGVPLWEDGHRWVVFADQGGARTMLYGAFVPNGHVEAAIGTVSADGKRDVVVHERTPQQLRTFVIAYERPGSARQVSAAYYQIEQWLPPAVGWATRQMPQ